MATLRTEKRYHKDVFMPNNLNFAEFWANVEKSKVIETAHFVDRKTQRVMPTPTMEQIKNAEIFEVYTLFGKLEKVCIKIYNEGVDDDCYVISAKAHLVTGWKRKRGDELKSWNYWQYDKE